MLGYYLMLQFLWSSGDLLKNRIYSYTVDRTISMQKAGAEETMNNQVPSNALSIFENNEIAPKYPEGEQALLFFIYSKVKYPPIMRDVCFEATVVVNIVIDQHGKSIQHKILRGFYPPLDEEVIRVLQLIEHWIPGTQNGIPVKSSINIPIRFRLE